MWYHCRENDLLRANDKYQHKDHIDHTARGEKHLFSQTKTLGNKMIAVVTFIIVIVLGWMIISVQNSVGVWDGWSTRCQAYSCNSFPLQLTYHQQSIVLLRTHRWSHSIETSWRQLRREVGEERVFVLYDVSGNRPLPAGVENVIAITESECKAIHPLHQSMWSTVESQLILAVRGLRERNVVFRYLWLIEYDVRCVGNWKDVLNASIHHCPEADFVADNVQPLSVLKNATWCWWWRNPYQRGEPVKQRWKCFMPVSRYSARYLQRLERELGKSTDFCEIYLPTMCMKYGDLTVGSLSPSCLGYPFHIRSMTEEQFRQRESSLLSNRLYHAIK